MNHLTDRMKSMGVVRFYIPSAIYFISGTVFISDPGNMPAWLHFAMKAILMPILLLILLINMKNEKRRFNLLLIAGLIFSWAGDIFLEMPSGLPDLFVPGLAAFLLAHISYILLFSLTPGRNAVAGKGLLFILPLLAYGILLLLLLYNNLGPMKLPVIVYSVVILLMLAGAISRRDKVDRQSFYLVLAGAILFVLSDSALALNKFGYRFDGASAFIMLTYIAAQYLIVTGYITESVRSDPG